VTDPLPSYPDGVVPPTGDDGLEQDQDQDPDQDPVGGHGDLTSGQDAVRDSVTVGAWTAVSRGTGMVRVLVIAAVLGPTYLGNAYQLTNALPNLIFYGFLGGSLFASLLVPSLVDHLDRGSTKDVERVAGAFLGVSMSLLAVLAPVALVVIPLLLHAMSGVSGVAGAATQDDMARWLLLMTVPQVLGYAIAGICAAIMNAQRRFALPAAAPAVENVAVIAVLVLVQIRYGSDPVSATPPKSELLLLGLGSTAAVAAHAALQWWGAAHGGVRLRPRLGWRADDVRAVLRRAVPSLGQSALMALQILALLVIATGLAGGVVALQIALNFYSLPIALVATPVALSLLPRLSRLASPTSATDFSDTLVRGVRLILFLVLPAATGYLVLAGPIARFFAGGRMSTQQGVAMIAAALASIACGLIGQAIFMIMTQASYARKDTRTPLRSMLVQCGVCAVGCVIALQVSGLQVLVVLGVSYSLANIAGAVHLSFALRRRIAAPVERWRAATVRMAISCLAMALVILATSAVAGHVGSGRITALTALSVGVIFGALTYGATQWLWRSQEAVWLGSSLSLRLPRQFRTRTMPS
jgi:putative peptidoglycan lipid II flippase